MLNELIQAIWAQEQGTIKPIQGEKRGAQSEGWITLIQAQSNWEDHVYAAQICGAQFHTFLVVII